VNPTRYFTLFFCFLMILPPSIHSSPRSTPNDPWNEQTALGAIEEIEVFLNELRQTIDKSSFDLDALLGRLDYDAEEILSFSKNVIAYEPYKGMLRGPVSTLMTRAGNALDQSVLLATLLKDSGYDARVVHGVLSESQAQSLLSGIRPKNARELDPEYVQKVVEVFDKHGFRVLHQSHDRDVIEQVLTGPIQPQEHEIYNVVTHTLDFIKRQLNKHEIEIDASVYQSEMLSEAQDYYWVQWRDSASGPWLDEHPVFPGEIPFTQPEIATTYRDTIPIELQHRFRFQAFIERVIADKIEVIPLMAPWERPVANLTSVPLIYLNLPDSLMSQKSLDVDLRAGVANATFFAPMFNGTLAQGAGFFDLQGNLVDPLAAFHPASGIFRQLGRAMGGAVEALDNDSSIPKLTAQWVEFTLISPGGREETHRRMIFDRIGPAARATGVVPEGLGRTEIGDAQSLFQRQTFMINTGNIPGSLAIDYVAERFLSALPLLKHQFSQNLAEKTGKLTKDLVEGYLGEWPGHLALFSIFEGAEQLSDKHRVFASGPNLVVHSTGFRSEEHLVESIDIVTNPRRAVLIHEHEVRVAPELVMQAGIWETLTEGWVLQGVQSGNSTWSAFARAEKDNVGYRVVADELGARDLALSPDTKQSLRADLAKGYVVIIPEHEPAAGHSGWWRLDLNTGEILGQFGEGKGSAKTELTILLSIIGGGSSFALFGLGTDDCLRKYPEPDRQRLCCVGVNLGFYLTGLRIKNFLAGRTWDYVGYETPVENTCGVYYEPDHWADGGMSDHPLDGGSSPANY
jgi:hypothetical protein